MAVTGSDITALRALATQFESCAERLNTLQRLLTYQLNGPMSWRGPDAERFRQEWNGREVPRISATASALSTAADALRRNADEQEQASGGSGGLAGIGSPSATLDQRFTITPADVSAILSGILAAGGIANDFAEVAKNGLSAIPSGVLDGAGVVVSLTSLVEGIATGDNLQTAGGVMGIGGSALGAANPVLGIAASAASLYGEMTLPTSNEDIDGVMDVGARSMFGKEADSLNHAQTVALAKRYEGPWGVANMISDSMDHKAAEAKNFFKGLFGG